MYKICKKTVDKKEKMQYNKHVKKILKEILK